MNSLRILFFVTFISAIFKGNADSELPKDSTRSISYYVETRASFSSGDYTPFWLVSNLQGLGAPKKNNGWVRGILNKPVSSNSRFSWGAGIDLIGSWNLPAPFNIHQLYGEIKYRGFYVIAGAKEIWGSYNNPRLSSGNLLFSGNAMPIPQVRIGTYGFTPFWGTKNWFWVKGYLAYGKFTDSKWEKTWVNPESQRTGGVLYNSRGLWLRGGNTRKFPLLLDVGIEMATQFGGTIYKPDEVIKMPTKLIDWLKAIVPLSGSDETPEGEQTNVQGNMVGSYYIAAQWLPHSDWSVKAYFEHYFEDHSQMTFEYGLWKDGLWGIEINFPKNPFIKALVYEYVATKDQTGAVNNNYTPQVPEQVSGRDNYYNHYLYGCWQNWGMGIGTPLALSPLYNRDHKLIIYNTRFIANHFGLEGEPLTGLNWRFLLTFSRNWGSYWYPLKNITDNCSGLIEVSYKPENFNGLYVKGAIGWDHGHLMGNNFGGMLSLGFEGNFSLKNKH